MFRAASTTVRSSSTTAAKHVSVRCASTKVASEQSSINKTDGPKVQLEEPKQSTSSKKKTMAEIDEELRLKMQGIAGDGGESAVEYEDGKPVAMKRGVKENMFRLI